MSDEKLQTVDFTSFTEEHIMAMAQVAAREVEQELIARFDAAIEKKAQAALDHTIESLVTCIYFFRKKAILCVRITGIAIMVFWIFKLLGGL
jgi:hypothetical protein